MPPVQTEQVGIFLASLEVGELASEPELREVEGFRWWEADAEMARGRPLRVQIVPICEGWHVPYRKGDRVRVLHNHGLGIVLGMYASAEDHGGHTHLAGRAGMDLRLGSGSGEWEALALHSRQAAELSGAWQAIEAIRAALAGASPTAVPGAATAVTAIESIQSGLGEITGGDAAAGVKGRKA